MANQFTLRGFLFWVAMLAALFGLGTCAATLPDIGSDFEQSRKEALNVCYILGVCVFVISVGLPISYLLSFVPAEEDSPLVHLRPQPNGIVVGTVAGTVVAAIIARGLAMLLTSLFGLPGGIPQVPEIMVAMATFFGAIGGALGGGLPVTRGGLIASLTLGMTPPGLWVGYQVMDVRVARPALGELIWLTMLFAPPVVSTLAGRWSMKCWNAISEEIKEEQNSNPE